MERDRGGRRDEFSDRGCPLILSNFIVRFWVEIICKTERRKSAEERGCQVIDSTRVSSCERSKRRSGIEEFCLTEFGVAISEPFGEDRQVREFRPQGQNRLWTVLD